MKLQDNKRVYFEPLSHTYLLDGDVVLTGVTSLMQKHGLSPDYSGIPQATLDNAAKEGTAIHNEIEAYDNGQSILVSPLIEEYRKLGLKHIASEYLVSDNEIAASKIDGVYEGSKKNSVILVDYKTTQKLHRRSLEWQLGIYKVFFERQNPKLQVEACYCLHIDKKSRKLLGLVPITPVSEAQVDALLDCERKGTIYVDLDESAAETPVFMQEGLAPYLASSEKINALKSQIKAIEEQIKEWENQVCEYMVENNLEELPVEGGSFKMKKAYERVTVDSAKLKAKFPDAYNLCSKSSTVKASVSFKPNQE